MNSNLPPLSATAVLMDAINSSHQSIADSRDLFGASSSVPFSQMHAPNIHKNSTNNSSFGSESGTGVSIMMKPITASTQALATSKKSHDKLFNIGYESLKLNNPVPFSALKNVKDIHSTSVSSINNNNNPCVATSQNHHHFPASNNNNNNNNKVSLIAQRSISFKNNNSSLDSLSNGNNTSKVLDAELGKPASHTTEKDMHCNVSNHVSSPLMNTAAETNNNNNCNYRGSRAAVVAAAGAAANENTSLCQSPGLTARSSSNCSNRKEKKTSVGYRLGKRKLLFEKRRQISDYALIFAMTGVLIRIIETEFSMSKLYNKVSARWVDSTSQINSSSSSSSSSLSRARCIRSLPRV